MDGNGTSTTTMEFISTTADRMLFSGRADGISLSEIGFYTLALGVLTLSWVTRAASPDVNAMAYKLGPPVLGRISPNLNLGSFLVFVALYYGASLSNWAVAWALLLLAALTCPKPIEMELLTAVFKSSVFGSFRSVETFMTDLMRVARELGAKQGLPNGAMVDALKFELPFLAPVFVLIDVHYVHFLHSAPSCEFFATDYKARDWFIGPNLLTAKSPPMRNPEWLLHRALTSAVNTDRSGIHSTMGKMVVQGMTILSNMSRDLAKRHGSIIDLCLEFEHIVVTAHLSAMFGQKYTDKFPMISKEVNYSAIKYSSVSNGMQLKTWMPLEGLRFLRCRRVVCDSMLWAIDNSDDSVLLDILRKAHKEGKINRDELVGTCLLFTYALAPSRTSIFGLSLLANLPHEQDKVAKEVRTRLPPLFNEKLGKVDPERVGVWMTELDNCDNLNRAVRETLRLYPGVPMFIPQMAARDVQIGQWAVPKGALTMSMPFLSQRDGNVHKNPDMFDPTRDLEKGAPLPDGTSTYFPFAMGPRSCQGQFYGELLVRAAMGIALQDHEFEAKGPVPPPAMLGFIHPMAEAYALIKAPPKLPEKKKAAEVRATATTTGKPKLQVSESVKMVPVLRNVDTITILYASTQGTSRGFADRLGRGLQESDLDQLDHCPAIRVCDAADYNMQHLTRESVVLFVVATFGHNQPPYAGTSLKAFVNKPDTKLPNLSYAVLALGNSVYPSFCSFGKLFDNRLAEIGAQRLMPVTLCDEIEGQESSFISFMYQAADVLYSALGGAGAAPSPVSVQPQVGTRSAAVDTKKVAPKMADKFHTDHKKVDLARLHRRFEIVELGRGKVSCQRPAGPIKEGAPKGTRDHPVELQVIGNKCLRPYTSLAQMRNIIIRTPSDNSLNYQPGDLLGVYPVNRLDLVTSLATRLGIKDLDVEFELRPLAVNQDSLVCPLPSRMTYWLALTSYLAIQQVPRPQLLQILEQYTTNPEEKSWLAALANGGPKYTEYAMGSQSLLETLYNLPSCKPDVGHLFETMPHLQPRIYSLSSSPLYHPGEAHLTVAEVIYQSQENTWKRGVCSTFLGADVMIPSSVADPDCRLLGFVMPNPGFHMPENLSTPIIMIGVGSGISPFRGFWQQRMAQLKDPKTAAQLGDAILYAGFQSRVNSCYLDEVAEAKEAKALTKVRIVYSREGEKKYVTHAITEDRWALWHDQLSKGAVVYVCGTINAANDVRAALQGVLTDAAGMSEEEALAWMETARDNGQYREDVFGESTKAYSKTRMEARLRQARAKLRSSFRFLGAKGIAKILESAPVGM